jgi:hypothetical protein
MSLHEAIANYADPPCRAEDASCLPMTCCKTEVILNLFQDPTGQVTRMIYT